MFLHNSQHCIVLILCTAAACSGASKNRPAAVAVQAPATITDVDFDTYEEIINALPRREAKATPRRAALQARLARWVGHKPKQSRCLAISSDGKFAEYGDSRILFLSEFDLPLPNEPPLQYDEGKTVKELEEIARVECQAKSHVSVLPNKTTGVYKGKDFVSVFCTTERTEHGLLEKNLPYGHRGFLAYEDSAGNMHVLRGPFDFYDLAPWKEIAAFRKKHESHKHCQVSSGGSK